MQSAHQNSSEKLENSRLFDSFLKEGAVLQTGSDSYKLFLGPFADSTASDCMQDLLYKPDFWDFTKKQSSGLSLLKAYKIVDLNRQEFVELVSEASSGEINSQIEWLPADKSAFQIQFDWLKTKIKESKISKGLPITEQIGKNFKSISKLQILKNILQKNSEQYVYGFWDQSAGFLGYTPEMLLQSAGQQFSTMALAGTWSKQDDVIPDFTDVKTQNEHQIVVQDILKQLSEEKLISKSETTTLELEYLFHLRTNFIFQTKNIQSCIQKLHPTAALGIYPRSTDLFLEFQTLDLQNRRKNFGAPFGITGPGQNFIVVGIRNIYWDKDQVSIYSGCGVTADSDFETEWNELSAKRNSVKKTLGLNL